MKHSDYYVTEEEKRYQAEFGALYDNDCPEGPKQKLRREALEKQAYEARKKYGIRFEDAFTAEGKEDKYAPNEANDT